MIAARVTATSPGASVATRAGALLSQQQSRIYLQTDRLFAVLFLIQWLAGIAAAFWLSPRAWWGSESAPHIHVWAAVYLGGVIALFPIALVLARPGRASTRHVIAVAQMLMSALLIQLTGGRIETHFHVFGSLAFLSFYRDWRILVPATVVIAADHFLRGWLWPQSVFGVLMVSQWRWVEHAGWVVFENIFLTVACVRSQREMRESAERSAQLEAKEERYRSVMEQAAEGICLLDPDTKDVLECNRAFRRLLGPPVTSNAFSVVRGHIAKLITEAHALTSAAPHDCQVRRADGSVLDLSVTVSRISFGARDVLCASVRDVTERRRAQEALRQSEERYVRAARGANDGLWDSDLATGEVYFSPRWQEMLGLAEGGHGNLEQWLKRMHLDDHAAFLAALRVHLDGGSEYFEHEHRMLHADGAYRWMLCRGLAVRDESGKATRIAGSQTDVTERHVAGEQLRHAALHDTLTGLPNRALFTVLLERALSRTRRRWDYRFAVLFVDIDRFKVINDSLGHLVGDQLLRSIADRMREGLRAGDVVARLGGDEFTLLVDDIQGPNDAIDVSTRIQHALKRPFHIGGHEVCVTASIGIATGSPEYEREEDLLRDADIAMYRAKALGKNRHQQFDVAMGQDALARLTLENDLRRALDRGEFILHYQPILSASSLRVVGFEALLRWQRAEGVLVAPAEFIPIAEETGLIGQVGAWVLTEATQQIAAWQEEFRSTSPLTIAVNMSPRQLAQPDFIDHVAALIRYAGLAPGTLHLEITENALIDSTEEILAKLWQLKELSVRLYLDDFGIGYSSLGYLHRFPLDMIKIDQSFIKRMEWREKGDRVVEAIITLGKNLGMGVVAEGVETLYQLETLKAAGCEQVQGYLFSPPVDAAGAAALLRDRRVASPRVA